MNVIRNDSEAEFVARWDETGSFGLIHLSKARLKEFVTSATAGPHSGKHVTSILIDTVLIYVGLSSWTGLHNGNKRP
jgi:hypothetical protein